MNVVTETEGTAGAVLLRAAQIRLDDAVHEPTAEVVRAPGNLTRALGISGADNGTDCCDIAGRLVFFGPDDGEELQVGRSPRVGISRAQERLSRYFLEGV